MDAIVPQPATLLDRWVTNPRKLLAYSLILGAAAGTWVTLPLAFGGMPEPSVSWWEWSLFGGLVYYSAAGYAGAALLRDGRSADVWAVSALVPQLFQVQGQLVGYKIVCGLFLTLTVGDGTFNVGAGALATFGVQGGDGSLPTKVAINLVPAAFLWYFYHRAEAA